MVPLEIEKEFVFKTSRSSGAGGQNVNKVETKVELLFNIMHSLFLTENQKKLLLKKLSNKISNEGFLTVTSSEHRTQSANKKETIRKFFRLMEEGLRIPKKRIPTKPSRASAEKRIKKKKLQAELKKMRKKNW